MHISTEKAVQRVRYFIRKVLKKGLSLLRFQLFMTCASLPFLTAAGVPLSKATVVGNILFAPFLTLFLILSSCIFTCELLNISSTLFTIPLEYLSSLWTTILMTGSRSWLFALPLFPWWLYPLCVIGIGVTLHYRPLTQPLRMSLWLIALMGIIVFITRSTVPRKDLVTAIPCFGKELTLIYSNKKALLINPGCLGKRPSAPSFVKYTLIPELTKRGISELTCYICAQPSTMNFLATTTLLEALPVKQLYIPEWAGKLSNRGWSAWERLRITAELRRTNLQVLEAETTTTLEEKITLYTSKKLIRKNGCIYPHLDLNSIKQS